MRKSVLGCAVIILYSIVFGVYSFHTLASADAINVIEASPQVLATSDVHFERVGTEPDPNEVFTLANQARAAAGSDELIADDRLGQLAAARADDMVRRQYYAHKNPDGLSFTDYYDEFGIKPSHACENLDITFGAQDETFVNEWLASTQGHRQCLTDSTFRRAGYAVRKMMLLDYQGHETPAYVVVAIHME